MPTETAWRVLSDAIETMLLYLGRGVVQRQLLAIALTVALAWLPAQGIWHLGARRRKSRPAGASTQGQRLLTYGLFVVRSLLFPLLSIATTSSAAFLFRSKDWYDGLVKEAVSLFGAFLIYRLLIVLLYSVVTPQTARRVHHRLLAPLFAMLVFGRIFYVLLDVQVLARLVVFTLFGSSITVMTLLMSTVGLYFWIDGAACIQHVLRDLVTSRTKTDLGALEASLTLARYLVIVVGVAIVLSALGFDPTIVAAITGGLSVGIGFGLQEVLSNFISGLLLLFEGTVHPGDVIEMNGEKTIVKHVSIRSTTVLTSNNIEIIIPNQTFLTSTVTTYTGTNRMVWSSLTVGTSYDSDPHQALEILEAVAKQHPQVLKGANGLDPNAELMEFGYFSIRFKLSFAVADPMHIDATTATLRLRIWEAFAAQGIEVM